MYMAGYMRRMGRCRSAHDKTRGTRIAKVRYCTWDPVFVRRDERQCPFFFYTGKWDAQVRSYLMDDVC